MLTTELIEHILATIPTKKIGLLGDLFLDRYLDIDPDLDEPSVETGLTVGHDVMPLDDVGAAWAAQAEGTAAQRIVLRIGRRV